MVGRLSFNNNYYTYGGVENGSYTFWDYEHVLYLPTLSGTALAVVQQLETFVAANAGVSGVTIDRFHLKVHRNGDGQPILPGWTPPNVP